MDAEKGRRLWDLTTAFLNDRRLGKGGGVGGPAAAGWTNGVPCLQTNPSRDGASIFDESGKGPSLFRAAAGCGVRLPSGEWSGDGDGIIP